MFEFALRVPCGAAMCLLLLTAIGCGSPGYEIAEVDGKLFIKGKPGHKVRIEFIPEVGVAGPTSAAETDAQGHFTMRVMDRSGESPLGAVVGRHRVTLSDLQLAASATGRGVPIRFGPEYTLASSTPLSQDVVTGTQTIELTIP